MEAYTLIQLREAIDDLLDNHGGDARLDKPVEIKPPTGVTDKCPVFVNGREI